MVNTRRSLRKLIADAIIIILLPFFVFPVYFVIAALLDWAVGDAYVVINFLYDSKGQILREFLLSWESSLPESFCFVWTLFCLMYFFSLRKASWRLFSGILIGLIVGFVAGKYLYGSYVSGLVITSMTGFFLAGTILLIRWIRS